MTVITPTVGRIVWFSPDQTDLRVMKKISPQPFAAQICHVNDDLTVNLSVHDHTGLAFTRQGVRVVQGGDTAKEGEESFCVWMPYQMGQAQKTSNVEAEVRKYREAAKAAPEGNNVPVPAAAAEGNIPPATGQPAPAA